ncbi:uncharacterized protein LOC122101848 [Dipodomys spectabilis]|uniref:uncharacterized protein LOC122101848 n=1 Tax=Dipodomys spectabilis TaxID=105255 RepID=UPI001C54A9DF|nr:uncharacterized protein LOC122101848 [Dipodomys spectabilis]
MERRLPARRRLRSRLPPPLPAWAPRASSELGRGHLPPPLRPGPGWGRPGGWLGWREPSERQGGAGRGARGLRPGGCLGPGSGSELPPSAAPEPGGAPPRPGHPRRGPRADGGGAASLGRRAPPSCPPGCRVSGRHPRARGAPPAALGAGIQAELGVGPARGRCPAAGAGRDRLPGARSAPGWGSGLARGRCGGREGGGAGEPRGAGRGGPPSPAVPRRADNGRRRERGPTGAPGLPEEDKLKSRAGRPPRAGSAVGRSEGRRTGGGGSAVTWASLRGRGSGGGGSAIKRGRATGPGDRERGCVRGPVSSVWAARPAACQGRTEARGAGSRTNRWPGREPRRRRPGARRAGYKAGRGGLAGGSCARGPAALRDGREPGAPGGGPRNLPWEPGRGGARAARSGRAAELPAPAGPDRVRPPLEPLRAASLSPLPLGKFAVGNRRPRAPRAPALSGRWLRPGARPHRLRFSGAPARLQRARLKPPLHQGEQEDSTEFIVLTFLSMACIAAVLLASGLLYCLRHGSHRKLKEKLSGLGAGPSTDATAAYQELCRQRMAARPAGRPEGPHASRISSVSSQFSDGSMPSPSARSSVSSWSEEPVQSTMDISTGHMVLAYMEDHLRNKNRLDQEWEALCTYQAEPNSSLVAQREENMPKNRSLAVLTYDHARILLKAENSLSGSDYINASPIMDHDPKSPAYIATQGPLPATVADFWQMVWESSCALIAMLTPLAENGVRQCHHYWPDEGSNLYHIYEVNLVSEHIWCQDFLVRSFYLKNLQTNETRTVTQFHFLSWHNQGVPSSTRSLLDFRRKVNKSYRGRSCPIIVHCSDGAGRSGTYILIDMVLNKMAKGAKEIDIAATLEHLRDQRPGMVQTKEQFEFALTAVAEEVNAILKALPQ